MKRIGNIFNKIIDFDNLVLADKKARLNKCRRYGIAKFDKDAHNNLLKLQRLLIEGTYKTSEYDIFTIIADRGKKERQIYRLPYFPDRIAHHAIMNVIEPILISRFTADTYSCIKGRGIHLAARKLKHVLKTDPENTKYCLKLDVKKFFPSVNQDIMMDAFGRIFKDKKFLNLMSEIIYSTDKGLPIGNYISQFAANLYLAAFDRCIKQDLKIKHYFRYCDDMVLLSSSKEELRQALNKIKVYLSTKLKLEVKPDWQIFPVDSRGIDFLGYVFRHDYMLLRKDMKKKFYIKCHYVSPIKKFRSLSSYWGWCKYGNCFNLWKVFTGTNNIKELKYILLSSHSYETSIQ